VPAVQVPPPQAAALESAELQRARQSIRERETTDLKALSDRLDATGRRPEAEQVRGRIETPPTGDGPVRFVPLPEVVPARARTDPKGLANVPVRTPGPEALPELVPIRASTSKALYDLAVRSLSARTKHYSLADECLRAVLDRDPNHAEARRLLGYIPHDGGWATPFAADQLRAGKVLHPTYGWVDAVWVPHLEQGELPAPGAAGPKQTRWLRAADADALRNSIERGWKIETEHFQIVTDVPLSEAIAFGRKLEAFHDLFFSTLADVVADDLPLARRFREKVKALPRAVPHTVYFFATQKEFVDFLKPREGSAIDKTLGLYVPPKPPKRRAPAYFFRDEGGQLDVTSTLYHEVSHQLLFESTGVGPSAYKNNSGNYWVFEGLGTYFETVTGAPDGALQVGGFVGPRIEVARIRLTERGAQVPVERLVRLGQDGFNQSDQVYLYYGEAMALTVYLMHGQGGRYREPFLDYVRDALRGRLRDGGSKTLDDRLGVAYRTLDTELLAALRPRP
jgi:hypothetical protein